LTVLSNFDCLVRLIDGRPAGICVALLKDTVPPSASRTGPAGGEDPVDEFLRVAEVTPVVQMAAVPFRASVSRAPGKFDRVNAGLPSLRDGYRAAAIIRRKLGKTKQGVELTR